MQEDAHSDVTYKSDRFKPFLNGKPQGNSELWCVGQMDCSATLKNDVCREQHENMFMVR